MFLSKLSILQFKNHADQNFELHPKLNIITGLNGSGKTNILDAIYYLSFCKSYFNTADALNIKRDADFFVLQGNYSINDGVENVLCSLKRNQKKIIKRNQKEYERLMDHIGLFPLVMVSPNDIALLYEGSDERRKFIDSVISQYDKKYLHNLLQYNKALQQRNALLKFFIENNKFDAISLEVWTETLTKCGMYIHQARVLFMQVFDTIVLNTYNFIANNNDNIAIHYETQLSTYTYLQGMANSLQRDRNTGNTTFGVHKDDLVFKIDDQPLKKLASQGQQKTFLLALRLAQYNLLKEHCGRSPLLLLDDIYDKLDTLRVSNLLQHVVSNEFGQVFITHTNNSMLTTTLHEQSIPYNHINLSPLV
jgi:DNA replication and repair protein RecF